MADDDSAEDDLSEDLNHTAPPGQIYVCAACGKRSRDLFGEQALDSGWDAACTLKAVLCLESSLVFDRGRVVKAH